MNERGIITSTTALCLMLILTIAIATMKNIAARQADVVRYYRVERELQAAAEDYFNEAVVNLSKNAECYGELDNIPKALKTRKVTIIGSKESAEVTIYLKKALIYKKIMIMSLAELPNYTQKSSRVYKKVIGYMSLVPSTTPITPTESTVESDENVVEEEKEKYAFKGYIY